MSTKAQQLEEELAETGDAELPEGWCEARIADVIAYALGGAWGTDCSDASPDSIVVNVIRGTEFKNWARDKGATAASRRINQSGLAKRQLREGDIVVEISGGGPDQPVGRTLVIDTVAIAQAKDPLICSNFCRQIRLAPELSSSFVNSALELQYSQRIFNKYQTETTNLRNLNFSDFVSNVVIPIAPRPEQERIVLKLEACKELIASTRLRIENVTRMLKYYRQAVLAAACSGKLTEDWRVTARGSETSEGLLNRILTRRKQLLPKKWNEPATPSEPIEEYPKTWTPATLDQVTSLITSGSRGWARYYSNSGANFIRAENINSDRLNMSRIAHVSPPAGAEGSRTKVQLNDLLITITGANVAKSAVVDRKFENAYVSQHIALVRPVETDISRFLYLWIVSPSHGRKKLLDDAYGAGKPGLNLDNLREMVVALPPVEEQHEIVARVEALFKLADAIEERIAAASLRAERLTQAILAKAFRGELVITEAELARKEGREYELASALLKRIKAEVAEKQK